MNHYNLICKNCNTKFERTSNYAKKRQNVFCSPQCWNKFREEPIQLVCEWCSNQFTRRKSEIAKSSHYYCTKSCAASCNNTKKRKSRRSKSETMLFNLIKNEFNDLEIIPNDKTMLNGYEVDIAIPQLKLAIEWNGIVHFKPIYGNDKLSKVQNNDKIKLNIAKSKSINLIVIPDLVSKEYYVVEAFQSIKKTIHYLLNVK